MNLKNKKTIYTLVGALIVVALIGASYAWLRREETSEKKHILHAGTLDLKLQNETSGGISMSNVYPVTEAEGLATTPYEFELTNSGTLNSSYSIYIDDAFIQGKSRMSASAIRYSLQKTTDDGITTTTNLLSDLGENFYRVIDSGTIPSGKTFKYKLYVWMDYDAGNSEQNKVFKAKLRVEASQTGGGYVYDSEAKNKVNYAIGSTFSIGTEKFYVIESTETTVTGLAVDCVNTSTNKQNGEGTSIKYNGLDDSNYKSYEEASIKTLVDSYANSLNTTTATGSLMTIAQLTAIGCNNSGGCTNSAYVNWIWQYNFWLKDAASDGTSAEAYSIRNNGGGNRYQSQWNSWGSGFRPVITVNKAEVDS